MIYARLDKRGAFVLCGRRDCGERLANVNQELSKASRAKHPVIFREGWHQDAQGMWRLTKFAQDRRDRWLHPGFRQSVPSTVAGQRIQAYQHAPLPAKARCPKCTGENILDAEHLGLSIDGPGV